MLKKETRERIEKATVRLTGKGGQGVVVPGMLIMTAAHCIKFSIEGGMVLGDYFVEAIELNNGRQILAQVYAVEPVADIGVLGMPDDQAFFKEAKTYEESVGLIEPVHVRFDDLELLQEIPVTVFTHKRKWIRGKVTKFNDNAHILELSDAAIKRGTSGGPVIDQEGRLLGIVSTGNLGKENLTAQIPRPSHALPLWVVELIRPSDA